MKEIRRKLYKGDDGFDARYTVNAARGDEEIDLRVYDTVGGDALVFLTDARARKLIADLERAMAVRKGKAV